MEQWPPRRRPAAQPRIPAWEVEDLCREPFTSFSDAVATAERLRAAGWKVSRHPERPGQRLVATVHDPVSYAVIGDIRTTQAYRT